MTLVTIDVTQTDIDKGARGSSGFCPIALAAKRALKTRGEDLSYISVGVHSIGWKSGHAHNPKAARDFVLAFDRGVKVAPFSFEIIPSAWSPPLEEKPSPIDIKALIRKCNEKEGPNP